MAAPLNHKQKKFALEYRISHNATDAALKAGYSSRGAATQGARLLANAEIRRLIAAADDKALAKVEAKGNRVLEELAHFAHSDVRQLFDADSVFIHPSKLPEQVSRAIKSFEIVEEWADAEKKFLMGRTIKVTLWPKDRGLELLGKNQKLFTDRHEHTVDESYLELLQAAHRPDGDE